MCAYVIYIYILVFIHGNIYTCILLPVCILKRTCEMMLKLHFLAKKSSEGEISIV